MCLSFNDHEDFHLRRGAVVLLLLVRLTALKAFFSSRLQRQGDFSTTCLRQMRLINLSDMAPVTPT